jgi:hypothetical protein
VRRPYFHVKPLDAAQLANWAKYLDYIEARGDAAATVILYERCLVACASYPGWHGRREGEGGGDASPGLGLGLRAA